jgi:hypothetical protein
MLTKELAQKLLSLVNSEQWVVMEEYLQKLQEQTTLEMAKAQSDLVIHQCQGRWNLLDRLKNLPNNVRDIVK